MSAERWTVEWLLVEFGAGASVPVKESVLLTIGFAPSVTCQHSETPFTISININITRILYSINITNI